MIGVVSLMDFRKVGKFWMLELFEYIVVVLYDSKIFICLLFEEACRVVSHWADIPLRCYSIATQLWGETFCVNWEFNVENSNSKVCMIRVIVWSVSRMLGQFPICDWIVHTLLWFNLSHDLVQSWEIDWLCVSDESGVVTAPQRLFTQST